MSMKNLLIKSFEIYFLILDTFYDTIFIKLIFSPVLYLSEKLESLLSFYSKDIAKIPAFISWLKSSTIRIFLYNYIYIIKSIIVIGLFLCVLHLLVRTFLKFENYIYLDYMAFKRYGLDVPTNLLNWRGFLNYRILFGKKLTNTRESAYIKELYGSQLDTYEWRLIYERLQEYYAKILDVYGNSTDFAEKKITFNQLSTINMMLRDLKILFRGRHPFSKSWMDRYSLVPKLEDYVFSFESDEIYAKREQELLDFLRGNWFSWFESLSFALNAKSSEVEMLATFLKERYNLDISDFNNFNELNSYKLECLFSALWHNTCYAPATSTSGDSSYVVTLTTNKYLFDSFCSFGFIIKELKEVEQMLIINEHIRSHFLNGIDRILFHEINREASALFAKHLKETAIVNEICTRRALFREKYINPITYPFIEFVFSIVYPLHTWFFALPKKLKKFFKKNDASKKFYKNFKKMYKDVRVSTYAENVSKLKRWLDKAL